MTLENLVRKGFKFDLRNPSDKKVRTSGTIEISEVVHKKILSFIDYLRSGTQISFSIAIDFTASNGEYSSPNSLHYTSHGITNQYERAI